VKTELFNRIGNLVSMMTYVDSASVSGLTGNGADRYILPKAIESGQQAIAAERKRLGMTY
jgi:hypothetical protein